METHAVTSDINELLRLSHLILNCEGEMGFRKVPVVCTASTGQTIRFAAPEDITRLLIGLLKRVQDELSAVNQDSISKAFSIFWLGFIAIHPFINGNGRTGKAYLTKKAKNLGFTLRNIHILDQILLLGDVKRDLSLLQSYFKYNLIPQRTLK